MGVEYGTLAVLVILMIGIFVVILQLYYMYKLLERCISKTLRYHEDSLDNWDDIVNYMRGIDDKMKNVEDDTRIIQEVIYDNTDYIRDIGRYCLLANSKKNKKNGGK